MSHAHQAGNPLAKLAAAVAERRRALLLCRGGKPWATMKAVAPACARFEPGRALGAGRTPCFDPAEPPPEKARLGEAR